MIVKKFMLPRDKVMLADPECSLKEVLDLMAEHITHSAVVVIAADTHEPVGIVTKADMLKAYQAGLDPKMHKIKDVMSKTIESVLDTDTRDAAAQHFEETNHKNAFVMDKNNHFVGLVSALDVAIELSKDEHAWPWNREALSQKYKVPHKCGTRAAGHTFEQISGVGEV